jgi:hypothetical protein
MSQLLRDEMKAADLLSAGLSAFATLTGYEIIAPRFIADSDDMEKASLTNVKGYRICKENMSAELSLDEMRRFENEVCDFVELKLQHLLREKGGSSNG